MALTRLNIQTQKRTIPARGPIISDTWNDTLTEITTDLASLSTLWNKLLVPLLVTIPDGIDDTAVNGYINGMDSRTIYANWEATNLQERFFNTTKNRPLTIYEVLSNIYNDMANLVVGTGTGSTTIIEGEGLTQDEKERIGIHVFDISQTSGPTSVDGKTDINTLNLLQIAKDLYGNPGYALNNNGTAILTNSNKAMVDALLELHSGNWHDDITLSHSNVPELLAIKTFIGQGSTESFPTYINQNFIGNGAPLETAISQLDSAIRTGTLARAYSFGSIANDQSLNLLDARGGAFRINSIISSAGTWTGTSGFIANIGDTSSGGNEKTGHIQFKNSTPTSTDLSSNPHLAVRINQVTTTAAIDAIQIESDVFASQTPAAGFGVGVGFGSLTAAGSGVGLVGTGRVSSVLVDPASATLTSAMVLASKGENNILPLWDNGAVSIFQSKAQTTNNTEATALSIPIPNSTIRVMNAKTTIIGTTANGLNYASFDIKNAFSTAVGTADLITVEDAFGGTGTTWNGRTSYSGSNFNVFVSGVNASTINWRVSVQLIGINA